MIMGSEIRSMNLYGGCRSGRYKRKTFFYDEHNDIIESVGIMVCYWGEIPVRFIRSWDLRESLREDRIFKMDILKVAAI